MWKRVLAASALTVACMAPAAASVQAAARHRSGHHVAPGLAPAQATAALGLDLLRRLPGENLVISPQSVETALAMLGEGARGETREQMLRVMHLRGTAALPAVGTLSGRILASGAGAEAPKLSIANGVFLERDFQVQPEYLSGLRSGFQTTPELVDFGAPSTLDLINGWVRERTEGVIYPLFHEAPKGPLVLVDAVYLDAKWETAFKSSEVGQQVFLSPGHPSQVPFLRATEPLPYTSGRGYQAVELPYLDSSLALLIVLPQPAGLLRAENQLSTQTLATITRRMRSRTVELSLPKFHIGFQGSLAPVLQKLGMRQAFTPSADLKGIAPELEVGEVIHAADINVDEAGTVAAAATGIEVIATGIEARPRSIPFDANHPFLFFLRDRRSGAVLFAGRLSNAASAQG